MFQQARVEGATHDWIQRERYMADTNCVMNCVTELTSLTKGLETMSMCSALSCLRGGRGKVQKLLDSALLSHLL